MKRPKILTVICVLGFLSIVVSFPQVFSPSVKKLGMFMPAVFGLLVAFSFMAYVGVWFMKRWGAELFAITFFAKLIFFIANNQMGMSLWFSAIFHLFFLVVFLRHYNGMDKNL
jgi:hypothetical protein